MIKKALWFVMVLVLLLLPVQAWADTEDFTFTEYNLGSKSMQISLPDGWYFNTPRNIDKDFLKVSENTSRKLIKYLTDYDIDYNLVSKDLLEEINIIFVNSSQSKMMYNFSYISDEVLKERAQKLLDMEAEEENGTKTTYHSYRLEKFNDCTFMIFEGTIESEEEKIQLYQYTTMVNGYGITCTYRGSEGADYEQGKLLLDEIVHTFHVDEIKEADIKTNMIKQMFIPAGVVGAFVLFTVFLFVRQLRKNKKEEAAKKAKEQK